MISRQIHLCGRMLSTSAVSKPLSFRPAKPPPIPRNYEEIERARKSQKLWSSVFYFVCFPCIIAAYINTYWLGEPPKRQKFKPWPYYKGPYTWSPFYNKYVNPGLEGYETTDEEFLECKRENTPRWSKHMLDEPQTK